MESLINIDKVNFQALFKQSIFIIRKLLIRDSRKVVIFEPGEKTTKTVPHISIHGN